MSTIALHSSLNIAETVRDRGLFQRTTNGKWPMEWRMEWPRDRWRHVVLKGDHNTLKVQYLENSWRCYLATIAIVRLLWNSTQYGRLS